MKRSRVFQVYFWGLGTIHGKKASFLYFELQTMFCSFSRITCDRRKNIPSLTQWIPEGLPAMVLQLQSTVIQMPLGRHLPVYLLNRQKTWKTHHLKISLMLPGKYSGRVRLNHETFVLDHNLPDLDSGCNFLDFNILRHDTDNNENMNGIADFGDWLSVHSMCWKILAANPKRRISNVWHQTEKWARDDSQRHK